MLALFYISSSGALPFAVSLSLCHYCVFLRIESAFLRAAAILSGVLIWSHVEGFSFLHRVFCLSIWLNAKNALSQQHTWSLCAAAPENRIPVHSVSPACYTWVCYFWKSAPLSHIQVSPMAWFFFFFFYKHVLLWSAKHRSIYASYLLILCREIQRDRRMSAFLFLM